MLAVLITLFLIHRRSREAEQVKRAQYWREQVRAYFPENTAAWSVINKQVSGLLGVYAEYYSLYEGAGTRIFAFPPSAKW